MFRLSPSIERINLQPAVVRRKASRPDDRRHSSGRQFQLENWIGYAVGIRPDLSSIDLFRKLQTISTRISIRFIQNRQVIRITACNVVGEIWCKHHRTVAERFCHAEQRYSLCGKTSKVDGKSAAGAAYCDGDVFRARSSRFGIPLTENTEPPAIVTTAVRSRRPVVRAYRKIDASSRP